MHPEKPWMAIARAQAGVITRGQLRLSGLTDAQVDHMLKQARLAVLCGGGVFLAAGAPRTHQVEHWRAVLATGGVLGFASAVYAWGMTDLRPQHVHVVLPQRQARLPPEGVQIHRTQLGGEPVRLRNGLPITGRAESLLDYLPTLSSSDALSLFDRAMQVGWLSAGQLEHRLRRQPGRSGNRVLGVLAAKVGDRAAAESERLLHQLLRRAGIVGWRANVSIRCGRLTAVGDVVFEQEKVVVEIDGMAYHIMPDRFQRDRTRSNALSNAGWLVLHFTWADLTERPARVVVEIRHALALRAGAASAI